MTAREYLGDEAAFDPGAESCSKRFSSLLGCSLIGSIQFTYTYILILDNHHTQYNIICLLACLFQTYIIKVWKIRWSLEEMCIRECVCVRERERVCVCVYV